MELRRTLSAQSQLLIGIIVSVLLFIDASVQSEFFHSEISAEFHAAQSSLESVAVAGVSVSPTVTNERGSNEEIKALTANATQLLLDQYEFCISKRERDGLDEIFSFRNLDINLLMDCDTLTGGTTTERFCVMSELRLYFENLAAVDTPPPNLNCNATGWDQACQAGWAGRVSQAVDINSETVPSRILDPLPCCAGFFCPRGLSCMIPCPLGAYCPLATLNHTTNMCEPYGYQVMQNSNLYAGQCGGADKWAGVTSAISIFCPAGHFCPTPIEKKICSVGHFCRLGSTDQEKCSHLTSCKNENLQIQNLQGVGGLILAGLLILLVVIYTCSDWLMDLRHRRKVYARDVAAREVLEHISKYRLFKETAKRQASKLTRKLTRTISRDQRNLSIEEELQHSGIASSMTLENQSNSPTPSTSRGLSANLSPKFQDVVKRVTDYSKKAMTHTTSARASLQLPNMVIPTKDTYSQRFSYAYGQIEKERALGHRGTSPGSDNEDQHDDGVIHQRLGIELTFTELSMVLKSSGRRILCNVTGKLAPGRITAIMGPSGAGKTTLLNGLAGKSTNTRTTGQVFVNGKPVSLQSYKRIIGFVPQDDIVHGSLTVEENLWFSANYRLPVNMPMYERVLVVERIIQSLGLGGVRDSLVGTVENRGISGGQRKRVNVGLELVIEPSLLILDEPTSGLDSTSSRLVLQALRREASEGVNVILVVHQPSYGLFKMFDDVMFLAKGGYTVYLGPIDEVEAYFSGLGLIVPERINPPDYYMDALEGIAVSSSPRLDLRTMPMLWMMHKGFPVPNDMVDLAGTEESTPAENPSLVHPESSRFSATFFQQAYHELYQKILITWDEMKTVLSREDNLSGRRTPGFFSQLRIILHRVAKQRFREVKVHVQDYVILLIAGACLGVLSNMDDTNLGSQGYHFTIIALALLTMIASLRTFSADKIQFWRESASGVNRVAFYLAKDTADLFNVILKPLIYLSMFYFLSNPRSSFLSNYVVTLVLVYCVTGLAYVLAILLEPAPAQLCAVFVPVIATLVVSSKKTRFLTTLTHFSYARYALEAYVIANAERYEGVWVITRCGLLASQGYRLANWSKCLLILFGYGVVARIVAVLSLLFSHRNRQK